VCTTWDTPPSLLCFYYSRDSVPLLLGWQVSATMPRIFPTRWGLTNFFCASWSGTSSLILVSQAARITGMSHWHQVHFRYFSDRVFHFCWGPASNRLWSSDLCLPSSWEYRLAPPSMACFWERVSITFA
jgi:hypothetical protein